MYDAGAVKGDSSNLLPKYNINNANCCTYNWTGRYASLLLKKKRMKKLILAGFALIVSACADDGGNIDCATAKDASSEQNFTSKSITSIANEQLLLNYVDDDGNNVFETGTYDPDDTVIWYNGQAFTDVVDQYNEDTMNLIWINGFEEGKNDYNITIDPTDSKMDNLTVYTTLLDFNPCTGPSFAIDSVFYDNEKQILDKTSDWLKQLTIVK